MPCPFRTAVEAQDLDGMVAALAEDVEFRSPVVFKPYHGRDTVGALLGHVTAVFEDFRYVGEITDGPTTQLEFQARVGDREIHGIDLVRHDADGLIEDFTVMVRPLSGAIALAEAMGARLAAAGG